MALQWLQGVLVAGSVAGHVALASPALAESKTFRFKSSPVPEVRSIQATLVQSWAYVDAYFLDPTFNGQDWPAALRDRLDLSLTMTDSSTASALIPDMLSTLGDPYTRVLPPERAADFAVGAEGGLVALGLGTDPPAPNGALRVAFVASGSAADRAGLLPGSSIVSMDGRPLDPRSAAEFRAALRASEVRDVQLGVIEEHGRDIRGVRLTATPLAVSAVQYASVLPPGSRADSPRGVGYLRVAVFSETAARDAKAAVEALRREGVTGMMLDLRDNPGGSLAAGVELAGLFLREGDPFVTITDRHPGRETVRMEGGASSLRYDGPMAVLMNGGTASVSEMVAGALRDDVGAVLVGENTLGKGRTQRRIPLSDGSLLLVSTSLFQTPARDAPVDGVGLAPDVACKPELVLDQTWEQGAFDAADLAYDPCVQEALARFSVAAE